MQGLEKFNISIDSLPNESGGKAGTVKELFDEVIKTIELNSEYFIEDEKYKRVDESKRPGNAKNASELFGVEGSFKKLDID